MQIWDNIICIHVSVAIAIAIDVVVVVVLLSPRNNFIWMPSLPHTCTISCIPISVDGLLFPTTTSRHLHCVYVCVYTSKLFMFRCLPMFLCVRARVSVVQWRSMILKTKAKCLSYIPLLLFFLYTYIHILMTWASLISQFSVANNYYCFCLKLTQEDLQINAHWFTYYNSDRIE